ncbi:MAG: glycogen/starch synthase [Candidatus Amulumruptor caecigallinarius]|nr:glycogen/starch synthase [Candidatus Amulumruptor caecigallinarius]
MTAKKIVGCDSSAEVAQLAQNVDLLFETSWEVCNKVGGIYAVLSTKAKILAEQFDDKLIFIGPDLWTSSNPSPWFKERKTILKSAASRIKLPFGITIRTGRWDIPGSPQVILVNPGNIKEQRDKLYAKMWELYGVDSLHAYGDYDDSCMFAVAAAIVIKEITHFLNVKENRVMAHFDEWTTGMGLLYLQNIMPEAATVFTTHATCIGRSICGNGKPLYEYFHYYNGDEMARELNMESKHSLEKTAAHRADCFTTVSEVTARECGQLLRKCPDVVTPNGFEPNFVPKTVKYNRLRKDGRSKLLDVAGALTGHQYNDDTFLIATSGRHEYRNKGLDMFIDAVARMDMQAGSDKEILAFILVPGWVNTPSAQLVENINKGDCQRVYPDYLTHRLNNEDSDEVCIRIRRLQESGSLKRVRIIYVPCYLSGNDGIINISYYDLLPAFDMTIFPSYYEPWGYTPLESVAFGVPTVTDDKAGFGQWVLDNFSNGLLSCGVKVVERNDSDYDRTCGEIVESTLNYVEADQKKRLKARNMAFLTSAKADWKYFIANYDKAYEIALCNAVARSK